MEAGPHPVLESAESSRSANDDEAPIVRMRRIGHRFGQLLANDAVDLDLFPGEIHALIGENGSGKSTLMLVLGGFISPSAGGSIEIGGTTLNFDGPWDAVAAGIGMVHQNPRLIGSFSVEDNLRIGYRRADPFRKATRRMVHDEIARVRDTYGVSLDLNATASRLTDAEWGNAALVAVLLRKPRVLILDEPSAVLSQPEEMAYFETLTRIAATGTAIVFITHKLREVSQIAARISVMRHGRIVSTRPATQFADGEIIEMMFGGPARSRELTHTAAKHRRTALSLEAVSHRSGRSSGLKRIDFTLFEGELCVVTGMREAGPGQLEALCSGNAAPDQGMISIGEKRFDRLTPEILRQEGVGYVPGVRLGIAVALGARIWENVIAPRRREYHRRGVLAASLAVADSSRLLESAGVRAESDADVSTLSGGMLQRLILAREIDFARHLLIISEPFRGLDARGSSELLDRLQALRDSGMAILIFSSDLDDVVRIADSTTVFHGGTQTTVPREEVSRRRIGELMLRGRG